MARLRGRRWQADVRGSDGERHRPTFSTQRAAEEWEEDARIAVLEGRPIPDAKTGLAKGKSAPSALHTLGGLFDHVAKSEWTNIRSAKTAQLNGRHVVDFFGRNKEVAKITSHDIAEMKLHFGSEGLAPATVNRKVSALSKMLNIAADAGVIDKVPRIRWNQEMQTKFRYLDRTEEAVLLAFWKAQGEHDLHDLCALLIDTGARCFSEMLPVKWDHFGPNFSSVTFWHTKTNSPRTVPLTHRSREILTARKAAVGNKTGPFSGVAHGDTEKGLTKHSMRHKWELMRAMTGMTDVTPHTLRHTCCTRLILGGADIKRVMTWMGHTAIATTMRYMQIRPTALEDVLHILEGGSKQAAA